MEALLAPWLSRAALSLEIDALPSPRELRERLWVDMALARGDDRDRWVGQFEVLELLALVIRADARAVWTLLLATQGKRAYVDAIVEAHTPLRFRLTVHSSVYTNDAAFAALRDALQQCVVPSDDTHHTAEFARVKSDLLKLLDLVPDGSDEEGHYQVALCLKQHEEDVPFERPGHPDMLTRLVELAENIRQHQAVPSGAYFQWTHVALNCQNTATLDVLYDRVRRLLACGLHTDMLTITQRAHLVDVGAAARFWKHALAARGVQSLTLSTAMDLGAFQGLCSALAVSDAPVEVSYWPLHGRNDDTDSILRWMWLALALLRPPGKHGGLRVALDLSSMTLEEARAVERIVHARDPVAVLRSPYHTETGERAQVHHVVDLCPGASVYLGDGPTSIVHAVFPVATHESTAIRVLDDVVSSEPSAHVNVLWAGAGLCWVRDADVLRHYEIPPPAETEEPIGTIDHLSLRFSSRTSLEAAAVLLRTIGPRVRWLTLHCEYSKLAYDGDQGFWCTMLRACPALERLDLTYVAVDSLSWLLDAACPLRVLSLDGVYHEDAARCLGGLMDALGDRNHALSQNLRGFHTQLETVEPCFNALLTLLETNRTLEKCVLSTETDASEWHSTTWVDAFRAHTVVPPPPDEERRRQLAFLSVFRACGGPPETKLVNLPSLDEHAMSLVLAFAASKQRQCDVVYREW